MNGRPHRGAAFLRDTALTGVGAANSAVSRTQSDRMRPFCDCALSSLGTIAVRRWPAIRGKEARTHQLAEFIASCSGPQSRLWRDLTLPGRPTAGHRHQVLPSQWHSVPEQSGGHRTRRCAERRRLPEMGWTGRRISRTAMHPCCEESGSGWRVRD